MSQENVEIVRSIYERWSEGDFSAALDLFDPHVLLVFGPEFADAGTYLGPEAVEAYTRDELLKTWTDFKIKADEILAAGDSVLVSVRQSGVGRASGVPAEARFFMLWSFRGGKVIRIESIPDRAQAFEAAGISE